MKTVTPFSGLSDPSNFVTSSFWAFGLLLLTVQTKATAKGHYHALEYLHPTMSKWDDMMINDNIFVKPLSSSFPLKC